MPEVELPNPEELEELKSKGFTRRVALTTAIFAVILALASLGGNYAMKEMLLAQQQASDQWAFYQAKNIREHYYRGQKMQFEFYLLERGETLNPDARKQLESLIKKMGEEEARYASEKKEIEREARRLEHERDLYRTKDPYFDFAEALLQIAIVLSSIAILSGSRGVFSLALGFAGLGALLALNGFWLFVKLPFFHH